MQTASRVREETLAEEARVRKKLEEELGEAKKRLACFEEREGAWKTLKGKHEGRIRQLEGELSAAKGAGASGTSKVPDRRGKGDTDSSSRIAELEKLLNESELERVALTQKLEDAGPVASGLTDMARDLYDRGNKALKHGRHGSLPEPLNRTAGHYLFALGPMAELVEGVAARTQSVMELEGRQLLEEALTELLSAAIHHVLSFPAEFVVEADVPPGEFKTFQRARSLTQEFAKAFVRGEE